MSPDDLKNQALAGIRRQRNEWDQIELFVRSLSPGSLAFLRDLLVRDHNAPSIPPSSVVEPDVSPSYRPQQSNGKIGRLRTSMGTLKQEILAAIESLDVITSMAVHDRLTQNGFKFSTQEPRREISSIAAWLRKFTKQGILIQTRSGRGRRLVEFRRKVRNRARRVPPLT